MGIYKKNIHILQAYHFVLKHLDIFSFSFLLKNKQGQEFFNLVSGVLTYFFSKPIYNILSTTSFFFFLNGATFSRNIQSNFLNLYNCLEVISVLSLTPNLTATVFLVSHLFIIPLKQNQPTFFSHSYSSSIYVIFIYTESQHKWDKKHTTQ